MPSLADFVRRHGVTKPLVILLEGRRAIPAEWAAKAERVGALLARHLPEAVFRTGNAPGSDVAFARGVASVDASRLEYVVPYGGWRRGTLQPGARLLEFDKLGSALVNDARDLAIHVSPENRRVFEGYRQVAREAVDGWETKAQASARLLLRDIVKVTGSPDDGYPAATVGLFYVSPGDHYAGGTGHTIRACESRGVPVHSQKVWGRWLEQTDERP